MTADLGSARASRGCDRALAITNFRGIREVTAKRSRGVSARAPKQARVARALPRLQQLIRINVDGNDDVFREGQFVESFADEAAQALDGFAADQNVETELTL